MKLLRIVLGIIGIVAVSAHAGAQDVSGTWQGTLQAGKELRLVIKITGTDGSLKAMIYSIDQGGQPISASAVSLQGTTFKLAIAAIGGGFEGKLDAAAATMSGTWTQGGSPLPLTLRRATPQTAWAIPEPPPVITPMAAGASPAFEVATIKPSNPDAQGKGLTFRGRLFATMNTTVSDLIAFAYNVHARQITGGPEWLDTAKYDISGQPDTPGQPNEAQLKTMLQKLLADRFGLTFHRDKKELNVYALVVGKTGPRLTKSEGDPNGLPALFFRGLGVLPARNATMGDLARVMQMAVLDRPVVDQTQLGGRFDFSLTWTPDESQFGGMGARVPPPAGDAAPGLFTAIQEQLGLKLDAAKAPVEVIVIDRLNRPSDN